MDLQFDWFGISCMTTDHFCSYLQNIVIQTGQAGGQWYSDTSPFSIPWICQQFTKMRVAPISKSFFAVSGSMLTFSPLDVVGMSSRNDTLRFDAIALKLNWHNYNLMVPITHVRNGASSPTSVACNIRHFKANINSSP